MADLVSWLLEQITKDEREAMKEPNPGPYSSLIVSDTEYTTMLYSHGHTLAECTAKRNIIAECRGLTPDLCQSLGDLVLVLLAMPYQDRPGFQDEWRR